MGGYIISLWTKLLGILLIISIIINIILYNIYTSNNNIYNIQDNLYTKDITKVVTISPKVKVTPPKKVTTTTKVKVKIDKIHVYEDDKGNVSVDKTVKGTVKVDDEVFDLDIKLDPSISFTRRHIPLRIAYLYQTPLKGAISTEYGALSALYPLKLPLLPLKLHIGVGIRGAYILIPSKIYNNTTLDIGVGRDWKGKSQFVVGLSIKL